MASWVQPEHNAYVNRMVRETLYSRFITTRPLFYFLAGRAQKNLRHLYQPYGKPGLRNDNAKFGVSIGGRMGLAKRETRLGSLEHEFRYQKGEPTGASNVTPGGATPKASGSSHELVATTGTRWTKTHWPLKIWNSIAEASQGDTKIGALLEEAVEMSFNKAFDDTQAAFWTDTLTAAQQEKMEWSDGVLGIRHQVSDGVDHTASGGPDESDYATFARVDRTETADGEDSLKSTVLWAGKLIDDEHLTTTAPTLELIRRICTIKALGGLRHYDQSFGDLVITTPELWNMLHDEADDQGVMVYSGNYQAPGKTVAFGYGGDVIQYGKTAITFDPDCPEGEMYVLSTGGFCYEIAKGQNYEILPWTDKGKTEEGGEDYIWSAIRLKHRLTLTMPWSAVKVVGLGEAT